MKNKNSVNKNEYNCEFSFSSIQAKKRLAGILAVVMIIGVVISAFPLSALSKAASDLLGNIPLLASASGNSGSSSGNSSSGNGSSDDSSSGNGSPSNPGGGSSSGNGSPSNPGGDSSSGNGSSDDSSSGNGSSSGDGTEDGKEVGKYKYNGFSYDITDNKITIKYSNLSGAVTVPSRISGLPVVAIGEQAFSETQITSIVLPSSVTEIGEAAFYKCSLLVSVTIPSSVTRMDKYIFDHCTRLTISCYPGSYAEGYAKDNGIPYKHISTAKYVSIRSLPYKDTYAIGESLDPTGLMLDVTYHDGSTAVVERGYVISSYDFSTAGQKQVRLSLSGVYTSFTVTVTNGITSTFPESDHPYDRNISKTWTYVHPTQTSVLRISFSSQTFVETGRDYIYIYDGNGAQVGKYTGNALAAATVEVPGNRFSIKLYSDSSVTYYGFKIIDVEGDCAHTFSQYNYNNDATCTSDGTKTAQCTKGCGATDTVTATGTKLNHIFTSYTYNNDATCQKDGTKTAYCGYGCGNKQIITAEGTELPHNFSTYTFNNDATCKKDGTRTAYCTYGCRTADTIPAPGTKLDHNYVNYIFNNDSTCMRDGTKTAYCTYGCETKNTITATGTKLDHKFVTYNYNNNATCMKDGTKTAYCAYGCETSDTKTAAGTKLDHLYTNYIFNNDATCQKNGTKTAACNYGCGTTDTVIAAGTMTDHSYKNYRYNNDATCTKDGTMTAFCSFGCGAANTIIVENSKLDHSYTESVLSTPDCERSGKIIHICVCGDNYVTETPATGHKMSEYIYNEDATCSSDGTKTAKCQNKGCTKTDTVKAEGTKKAHSFTAWQITLNPTPTTDGQEMRSCRNCSEIETRAIPKTGFENPFKDVKDSAWYADEVAYVVSMDYMTGMSATKFNPNGKLTREQFVLILANIARVDVNKYKNINSGFTDVKTGQWYSGAITWAVSEGYVSGVSAGKFGRGQSIQRAALARMLYNYCDKNGMDVSGRADLSVFADASLFEKSGNAWMKIPVQWAVDAGIISGMDVKGKLSVNPRGTATRAQAAVMIVAFDKLS